MLKIFKNTSKRRQSYCLYNGKSSARVKIFQRSATNSLRKFINIDEVIHLAQDYTNQRVEIVSVNASTSIAEQIRFFNEFDILITPHGSHLANGIFTVRPQNKVINLCFIDNLICQLSSEVLRKFPGSYRNRSVRV